MIPIPLIPVLVTRAAQNCQNGQNDQKPDKKKYFDFDNESRVQNLTKLMQCIYGTHIRTSH